eukprot:UN04973
MEFDEKLNKFDGWTIILEDGCCVCHYSIHIATLKDKDQLGLFMVPLWGDSNNVTEMLKEAAEDKDFELIVSNDEPLVDYTTIDSKTYEKVLESGNEKDILNVLFAMNKKRDNTRLIDACTIAMERFSDSFALINLASTWLKEVLKTCDNFEYVGFTNSLLVNNKDVERIVKVTSKWEQKCETADTSEQFIPDDFLPKLLDCIKYTSGKTEDSMKVEQSKKTSEALRLRELVTRPSSKWSGEDAKFWFKIRSDQNPSEVLSTDIKSGKDLFDMIPNDTKGKQYSSKIKTLARQAREQDELFEEETTRGMANIIDHVKDTEYDDNKYVSEKRKIDDSEESNTKFGALNTIRDDMAGFAMKFNSDNLGHIWNVALKTIVKEGYDHETDGENTKMLDGF